MAVLLRTKEMFVYYVINETQLTTAALVMIGYKCDRGQREIKNMNGY